MPKSLLEKALADLKDAMKDIPNEQEWHLEGPEFARYRSGILLDNESAASLRLDWELADDIDADKSQIWDLMLAQMENDLEDLIANGDTGNIEDALYKSMDGSIKRGTSPVDIKIIACNVFSKPVGRKGTVEYAVFIILYVRWHE